MAEPVRRVVALGASNLTRGLATLVAGARAEWGPAVEVVAALGHGRSYGADSRLLGVRRLPGILESGLWAHLEASPPAATRALVTDVGNDILYGFSVEQTLAWVREAIVRLKQRTADVVLSDLPMASIRRLAPLGYRIFRALVVPSCRLELAEVRGRAEALNAGLEALAASENARLFRLDPAWYGVDPIHIRPAFWSAAWRRILGAEDTPAPDPLEALALYAARPERQWLCGLEQRTPQTGRPLRGGGRLWLY